MAVRQLFRTATLFDTDDREVLHGQLICYARAVVEDEWQTMREQGESARVDGWLDEFEQTIRGIEPATAKQEAAHAHWLSRAAERQEGRRGRLAEAAPVVPPAVWAVLILAGLLVIGYICLCADPAEPVLLQAFMMAAVVTLVVSGLLLVRFLDVRTRRAAVACVPPQWSG